MSNERKSSNVRQKKVLHSLSGRINNLPFASYETTRHKKIIITKGLTLAAPIEPNYRHAPHEI